MKINTNINTIVISESVSIVDAMTKLNLAPDQTLFVVSKDNVLLGTLTDGDLRRSIIAGADLHNPISSIYNKEPHFLIEKEFNDEAVVTIFLEDDFKIIPVISDNKKIIGYISAKDYSNTDTNISKVNIPVVIMAGGRGSRLEPFTKILPKPLIPLNEKAIIEHIIDKFTFYGNNSIYLTLNYKSKLIKAFFDDLQKDYTINFIDEKMELGTAGSLKLLEGVVDSSFFISNCDVLVDVDLSDFYNVHNENNNLLTVVVSTMKHILPYGSCDLNSDGSLRGIIEKPATNHLVNTGFYIMNSKILKYIPENKSYDMPELIVDTIKDGGKVGIYPISDNSWIDVGQWPEYNKALEKF
jgi:dTDP-glucose pyrophosphorylase/CBS domain-containing protein